MKKKKLDKKLQEKVGRDFVKEGIIVALSTHYPEIIREIETRIAGAIFMQLDDVIDKDYPINEVYRRLKKQMIPKMRGD